MTLEELRAAKAQKASEFKGIVEAEGFEPLNDKGEKSPEALQADGIKAEIDQLDAKIGYAVQAKAAEEASTVDPRDSTLLDTATEVTQNTDANVSVFAPMSEDEARATAMAQRSLVTARYTGGEAAAAKWLEDNKSLAKLVEKAEAMEAMEIRASAGLDDKFADMPLRELKLMQERRFDPTANLASDSAFLPKNVGTTILEKMQEQSPFRGRVAMLSLDSAAEFVLPTAENTGHAEAAEAAEGADTTGDWDPNTGGVSFKPQRIATKRIKANVEFLRGSTPNVNDFLVSVLADQMGQEEGNSHQNGTGNIKGALVSVALANATTLGGKTYKSTVGKLNDLDGLLVSPMRRGAWVFMRDEDGRGYRSLAVDPSDTSTDIRNAGVLRREPGNASQYVTYPDGIQVAIDQHIPNLVTDSNKRCIVVIGREGYYVVDYPGLVSIRTFDNEDAFRGGYVPYIGRGWFSGNVGRPGGIGVWKSAT